jgi:hypothetical protein
MKRFAHIYASLTGLPLWWVILFMALLLMAIAAGAPNGVPCAPAPSC